MKKFVHRILYHILLCTVLISSGIYASVMHSENPFTPVVSSEAFDGRTHKPSIEKFPGDVIAVADFLTQYPQIVDECRDRGFGLDYVYDIASKINGIGDSLIPTIDEAGVISLIAGATNESKIHPFIDYNDCSEYFSDINLEILNGNGFNIISNGDGAAKKNGKRVNLVTTGKLNPTELRFLSTEAESTVEIDSRAVSMYTISASETEKFDHLGHVPVIRFFDPRISQYENFDPKKFSPIIDGLSIFANKIISVPSDPFHRGNIRGSTPTKEQINELAPSFAAALVTHGITEEKEIDKWYEMFAHFAFEVPSKGNVLFGGLLEYLRAQGNFEGVTRFALIDDSYEKLVATKDLLLARGATTESNGNFRMPNDDEIILRQYVKN